MQDEVLLAPELEVMAELRPTVRTNPGGKAHLEEDVLQRLDNSCCVGLRKLNNPKVAGITVNRNQPRFPPKVEQVDSNAVHRSLSHVGSI